jgi:hypothetical protein
MAIDSPLHAAAITPSDTADLAATTDFISFVNSGAQTLQVTTFSGETLAIGALPSGQYRMRVRRVWSTGTTVTSIVGYWT